MLSKFPHLDQTIFSTISQMALEYKALNMGQGFPSFAPPSTLTNLLSHYAKSEQHQYAPMSGIEKLKAQIAKFYSFPVSPVDEITVTSGASEALFCTMAALIHPGDEVIIFDPSFDCYIPQVELYQGIPVRIPLTPENFQIPWQLVHQKLSHKTKAIILNFPHNPCGSILSKSDIVELEKISQHCYLICDEVYQHMIFDGKRLISPALSEKLKQKTIVISSLGKSLHVTGWKVGYSLASKEITHEIRKIHQYNTFSSFTPGQWALADFLEQEPNFTNNVAAFYQAKRDLFLSHLDSDLWCFKPAPATYFQLLDYRKLSTMSDLAFCQRLIREYKIATIPISGFYANPPSNSTYLRVCFAKEDHELIQAAHILNNIKPT